MATKEVRPLRICDVCGQVDDHPRHVFVTAGLPVNSDHLQSVLSMDLDPDVRSTIAADVVDTTTQLRHMDCCREVGCPDGTCNAIAETGAADLKGAALVKHLTSGKVDDVAAKVNAENAKRAAAAEEGN